MTFALLLVLLLPGHPPEFGKRDFASLEECERAVVEAMDFITRLEPKAQFRHFCYEKEPQP